jgi:hypothetical protein
MWAMASSSESTTLMLMMGARYSSDQSCSVASTTLAPGTACQQRLRFRAAAHLHALGRKHAPMRGRKAAATPRATSRLSVALQGLYFCVLALSVTLTRQVQVAPRSST